jgi:hypothetical protein
MVATTAMVVATTVVAAATTMAITIMVWRWRQSWR